MATITSGALSNNNYGTGQADITVKDLDMTVSNYVKDQTPFTNMAMSKKKKINNVQHLWPIDTFRTPGFQARNEGSTVNAAYADSNSRNNMWNYSQIFTTVVGATGTARSVEQAGGDPQAYQEVKQLTEIMFDVELQMVRSDALGTKYSGQSGAASNTTPGAYPSGGDATYNQLFTGRRFASLPSLAGTVSHPVVTGGTGPDTYQFTRASDSSDTAPTGNTNKYPFGQATAAGALGSAGLSYFAAGNSSGSGAADVNEPFSPVLYKALVTAAEQRFNAKITNVVCPTSLRTTLSDNLPQSRTINRVNSEKGDTISTYEGDFGYTYQISDNWIMDSANGPDNNNILFVNPDVIQWGSLRELGPNNEVFSNADASLDQYIMEGTLIVRNPAGVALLRGITTGAPTTSTTRAAPYRYVA